MENIKIGVTTKNGKIMTYPNEKVFEKLEKKIQNNFGIKNTFYVCPDCGDIIVRAEGCGFCPSCGFSPCK